MAHVHTFEQVAPATAGIMQYFTIPPSTFEHSTRTLPPLWVKPHATLQSKSLTVHNTDVCDAAIPISFLCTGSTYLLESHPVLISRLMAFAGGTEHSQHLLSHTSSLLSLRWLVNARRRGYRCVSPFRSVYDPEMRYIQDLLWDLCNIKQARNDFGFRGVNGTTVTQASLFPAPPGIPKGLVVYPQTDSATHRTWSL